MGLLKPLRSSALPRSSIRDCYAGIGDATRQGTTGYERINGRRRLGGIAPLPATSSTTFADSFALPFLRKSHRALARCSHSKHGRAGVRWGILIVRMTEQCMIAQRRRRILGSLLALHIAAGPASSYLIRFGGGWPSASVVGFVALFLADASLVGFWAGLNENPTWRRAAVAAAGSGYLILLPYFSGRSAQSDLLLFAGLATFSLLPGFLVATLLRRVRPGLRLALTDVRPADLRHLQVSTRFLFGFTAAVAVLLMIFQSVQRHVESTEISLSLIVALSYGWICCVVALAVLVPRKAGASTCAAIAVCPLAGAIPTYYLGTLQPNLYQPVAWAAMAGADAAIIAATLLVVRWCGYRLVPRETIVDVAPAGAISNSSLQQPHAVGDRD